MQAADDGAGSAAGAGRGADGPQGRGSPDGLQGQRDPGASHCLAGQNGSGNGRDSNHSSQGGPDGQGEPDGSGGHTIPGDPDSASGASSKRAVDAPGDPAPRVQLTPHGSRPGGDAVPAAGGPASRLIELNLMVPFRSPLEAQMVIRALARHARHHVGMIHEEFTVNNSILAVRWIAEDPVFFHAAINTFLDHLCMVMRAVERSGPPLSC